MLLSSLSCDDERVNQEDQSREWWWKETHFNASSFLAFSCGLSFLVPLSRRSGMPIIR